MSSESKANNQVYLEKENGEESALVLTSKKDYERFAQSKTVRINTHLSEVVNSVPFYSGQRDKYVNIDLKSLYKFPLTHQDDLLKDPYQFVSKNKNPVQLSSSGGTYGKRKILFRTSEDMEKSANTAASMFSLSGIDKEDVVAIMQPFDLWNIGHIGMQALKKIGALSIPLGLSAKEDEILDMLAFSKATTLYGTPSKIVSLAILSEAKGLISGLNISKVLCAGEPILEDHRQLIQNLWGAEIFGIYGSEETDGIGAECKFHNGYHILDKNSVFEILDPKTMSPAESQEGVLAMTNVGYSGTTFLRYLLGDLVQINTDICECGEKSPRIKPRGRLEETVWLFAGTKITTKSVEELLKDVLGKVPQYQIVVKQETNKDVLTIKINTKHDAKLMDDINKRAENISQDLQACIDSGRIEVNTELIPEISLFESTLRGKVPKIIYKREGNIK